MEDGEDKAPGRITQEMYKDAKLLTTEDQAKDKYNLIIQDKAWLSSDYVKLDLESELYT